MTPITDRNEFTATEGAIAGTPWSSPHGTKVIAAETARELEEIAEELAQELKLLLNKTGRSTYDNTAALARYQAMKEKAK